MRKVIFVITVALALIGCNEKELASLRSEISQLQAQAQQLRKDNEALKEENNHLKETDQAYLDKALEFAKAGDRLAAIQKLHDLQLRFNHSPLLGNVVAHIKRIETEDSKASVDVIESAKKKPIKEALDILSEEVTKPHLKQNAEKLKNVQTDYLAKYEKEKVYLEAQAKTGIAIDNIVTYWGWTRGIGDRIFAPHIKIKFKNVSKNKIDKISVKATFVKSDGEVFGTDTSNVIGYGDDPLRSGQSKLGFLNSGIGYTSDLVTFNLPYMKAEIYINDQYFKNINISRSTEE